MTTKNLLMTAPAAGGGGFTDPTDIAGLSLWLDASEASTITDTAGAVTAWTDQSSNAYSLTNPLSSPTTNATTLNSLNVIDFGANKGLQATAAINNASDGSWTIFAVAVMPSTISTESIVDGDGLGATPSTRIGQYLRTGSGAIQSIGFNGGTAVSDTGPTVSSSTAYVLATRNTASTIEAFSNGGTNGSSAITGQSYNASVLLTIGMRASSVQDFTGSVAEVVAYDSDLSDADTNSVGNYLADKWGLTWTDI